MRIFAIADASKRKAKPIGLLTWTPNPDCEQGSFRLAVSSACSEDELPLSLSFCARRERGCATLTESEEWVRSRIVPEDRHNIVEVLAAHGLATYSEIELFANCQGRSSDDDFLAYEVELPEYLAKDDIGFADAEGSKRLTEIAERMISAMQRRRVGSEVHYALVGFANDGANEAEAGAETAASRNDQAAPCDAERTAASRIGEQIRVARLGQGLSQRQLAARAGITQTVLSRIESGKGNPTLALLEEIAASLGLRLTISLRE